MKLPSSSTMGSWAVFVAVVEVMSGFNQGNSVSTAAGEEVRREAQSGCCSKSARPWPDRKIRSDVVICLSRRPSESPHLGTQDGAWLASLPGHTTWLPVTVIGPVIYLSVPITNINK